MLPTTPPTACDAKTWMKVSATIGETMKGSSRHRRHRPPRNRGVYIWPSYTMSLQRDRRLPQRLVGISGLLHARVDQDTHERLQTQIRGLWRQGSRWRQNRSRPQTTCVLSDNPDNVQRLTRMF
jgi:hypothetical protein